MGFYFLSRISSSMPGKDAKQLGFWISGQRKNLELGRHFRPCFQRILRTITDLDIQATSVIVSLRSMTTKKWRNRLKPVTGNQRRYDGVQMLPTAEWNDTLDTYVSLQNCRQVLFRMYAELLLPSGALKIKSPALNV